MIERQIQKFMEKNTDFIARFVMKFMQYNMEDTGHSLKIEFKIGDSTSFETEIDDDTARTYLRRVLSSDDK